MSIALRKHLHKPPRATKLSTCRTPFELPATIESRRIDRLRNDTVRQPMHNRPRRVFPFAVAAAIAAGSASVELTAQEACCFQPAYRLQCETVMEPQTVARYRLEYQTEYEEQEVVSYRPVLKTRTEQRSYRVAKPVTKTSYREERYYVQRPVLETSYRDETVTQTRYVTETAEREEQVTSYRPVTETQYRDEQYSVQRPVTETQYQDQQYTVQRPVTETQYQTQQYTTLRPVTSYRNQVVDAGGYVPQQVVQPGTVQYGLGYQPEAYRPGPFGFFARRIPGGPVVVPQVTPPTVQTQMAYRPNYITQQVPETTYVPQTVQQQVPVQVQRMQTEVVTQKVPVAVTRMQTETMTRKVPVEVTRYEPVTEVRKIPYQVQKPITETLTRKVPEQKYRWVTEEKVRKVPVTTQEMTYETSSRNVEVPYYEQERVVRRVRVPKTKAVWVRVEEQQMVPKQVVQRIPFGYSDPFAAPIVMGHSSFGESIIEPPPPVPAPSTEAFKPETTLKAVEVEPATEDDVNADIFGAAEAGDAEAAAEAENAEEGGTEESEESSAAPSDLDDLEPPSLNSPAVHRIRILRPQSRPAREA